MISRLFTNRNSAKPLGSREVSQPFPVGVLKKLASLNVSPASHLRVVQWGGNSDLAEPWLLAGANVVGLTSNTQTAKAWKENQFRFHHTAKAEFSEIISGTYVRPSNADLFFVDGSVATADVPNMVSQVSHALDASGVCVWECRSTDTQHLKNEFARVGMSMTFVTEKGRHWAVAQKAGVRQALPERLQMLLTRTSCVDRRAVLNAWKAPIFQGNLAMRENAKAYASESQKLFETVRSLEQNPDLPETQFKLPTVSPMTSRQEKPACDVLVLLAHPDDESGFAGGTLAKLAKAKKRIRVVSATGGEGGQTRSTDKTRLAQKRSAELKKVAELLGIEKFEVGEFKDFGKYRDLQRSVPVTAGDTLRTWGASKVLEAWVRAIRTHRPRTMLTFSASHDPDFALHGHHLALGKISLLAFHLAADPLAFPEHFKQGLRPWATESQWAAVSPHHEKARHVIAVPINVKDKRRALEAHGSQMYSLEETFKAIDAERPDVLKEYWHLVQSREGATVLIPTK